MESVALNLALIPRSSNECGMAKRQRPSWFFLSFADSERFLGGAFVRSNKPRNALQCARELGIQFVNATVQCTPLSETEMAEHVPLKMRARLLNEAEVRALGGV